MFLAFIGSVFIAYRGIDRYDNRIHNALGTLAFCVAIFPMRCNTLVHKSCVQGILPVLHLPSAISLYAFAFIAVHYGGGKRLKDVIAEVDKINENNYLSKKMKKTKYFSLALMTLGMIAFLVHKILKNFLPGAPWIWSVEYLGFLGFGAYWWCLTYIIDMANKIGLKREKDDGGIVIGLSETMAKRMVAPLASPIVSDEKRWDFIP